MRIILNSQTSIFAIIILLIILVSGKKQQMREEVVNRIYYWLIYATILVLIADVINMFVDGVDTPFARILMYASVITGFILQIAICMLWMLYVEYSIRESKKYFKVILFVNAIIMLTLLFVAIFNLKDDTFFRIAQGNIYQRGKYFPFIYYLSYGIMFLTFLNLVLNKKRVYPNDFWALIFFPIIPMAGGIIQIIYTGFTLIWPGVALSIVILYIFVQSQTSNTDYLTGLSNRREYERVMKKKYENLKNGYRIAGVMIDIDDFKSINNEFMHHIGDEALVEFSNILKESAHKNDLIARIGGDEFVIVNESRDAHSLENLLERIFENLKQFNDSNIKPYKINISTGFAYFDPNIHKNLNDFFIILDKKMYEMKKNGTKKV